ncbi:peptide chain release factor, putative [Theileria annulata]|uniref:Peptide chain release factor, putative n=1 Tax=Theileria annulata TaxID=5874 RepID=Q4UA63_THEAN|nr:peptide chain release factor, putative [Theileria annulata]CAI76290.1 peptide chain release factor, putative [Theileria annulata]|eukprot:XP_952914.1 peptide chain release factor, putative [Theileria annulata]
MIRILMVVLLTFVRPSLSLIHLNPLTFKLLTKTPSLGVNLNFSFISTSNSKFLNLYYRNICNLSSTLRDSNTTTELDPLRKYDRNSCKLIIKSGVGGSESFDWCRILTEMYKKFISHYEPPDSDDNFPSSLRLKEVDVCPGSTGGFRRVEFDVIGDYAYRLLKGENGTHRLIRNSPFNSENKRQTSFGSVQVVPILSDTDEEVVNFKKNRQLLKKDLIIESMRSSGKGGQNVNKVETAGNLLFLKSIFTKSTIDIFVLVRVYHKPTGLSVKVQQERTNTQNREIAIRMLTKLVDQHYLKKLNEKVNEIKGEDLVGTWGSHIRTYTLNPEQRVKDHRTNFETSKATNVLNGDLLPFILTYLNSNV